MARGPVDPSVFPKLTPALRPAPPEPADKYERNARREAARLAATTALTPRQGGQVLEARRIGREIGVPPAIVEGHAADYQFDLNQKAVVGAVGRDPWLSRWFSREDDAAAGIPDAPRMASIGEAVRDGEGLGRRRPQQRDLQGAVASALGQQPQRSIYYQPIVETDPQRARQRTMQRVNTLLDPGMADANTQARRKSGAGVTDVFKGWAIGTGATFTNALNAGQMYVGDALGIGYDAEAFAEERRRTDRIREGATPLFANRISQGIYGGGQSLADMLTVGTVFGPSGLLPGLTGVVSLDAYGKYRTRGATPNEALAGGVAEGAIEYLTEKLPISYLTERFGKGGAKEFIGGFLLPELLGEQIATAAQDAVDTAIASPNKSWDDYWAERGDRALDTAISTLAMTGGIGAVGIVANRLQRTERELEEAEEALAGANVMERIITEAEGSEMRKGDPETFRRFLAERTDGTPVQSVYVPVEALAEYMQSEGYEPGFFERYEQQIEQAAATGGDVVIPLADVATDLAGTPAWDALRESVRLSPGGVSPKEGTARAEEIGRTLQQRGEEIAREAAAEAPQATAAVEVYTEIKNQLLSIGRTSREAEALAQLYAASRETWGRRLGQSAVDYHRANPIQFADAKTGARAGGRVLDQQDENLLNIGLATHDGVGITSEQAIAALTARGIGVRASSVIQSDTEPTLVAQLDRSLTPQEADEISVELGQDAIAQVSNRAGELYGPSADAWRPFNPDYFLTPDGERLSARRTLFQGSDEQKLRELLDHAPGIDKLLPYLEPDEKAKLRKSTAKKLTELVETFPDAEEMASVAYAGRGKRGWYERSALAILDVFGVEDAPRFAALLAATSPQTSVEMNLTNALRIWTAWSKAGRPIEMKAIKKIMGQSVVGNKGEGSVLGAWVNNTFRALSADNAADITLSGPKVNSFMLNLVGVVDEVTNDAWMANYALIDQTVFTGTLQNTPSGDKVKGKSPGYIAFNTLVRRAAEIVSQRTGESWTPAEVQETVWSWAKTVTETRAGTGRISVQELLEAGRVTQADIAATPDFAMLFQTRMYRRILEEGGYGEEVDQLGFGDRGSAGRDGGEGSVFDPEGAGLAPDDFRRHLLAAGERIETRVAEQLAGKGRGSAIAKSRREESSQADLFGGYQPALEPLVGLQTPVKVGGVPVDFGPFGPAREAARRYALKHGLPHNPPTEYAKVDRERAERIAAEFEAMEHAPNDPEVKRAYRAMIEETIAQYKMILETGLQIDFIEGDDPYGNPRNAILDVVNNNHLWVFPTDTGFGGSASADIDISGNPLLEIVPNIKINGKPVRANDIFRIVHDYFGHIKEGVGFRADGEENAWRIHSSMYSPLARRAMTTETRGQNSWVNFGPYGEFNRTANGGETQYAPQKIGLLPEWVSEEGSGQPRVYNQDAIEAVDAVETEAGWTPKRISQLIADTPIRNGKITRFATVMSPDDFLGLTASADGRRAMRETGRPLDETELEEAGPIALEIEPPRTPSAYQISLGRTELPSATLGHDGRHRMTALKDAGVTRVPVVVNLRESVPVGDIGNILITPQHSRLGAQYNGDTEFRAKTLIPVTAENRERLEALGGERVLFQEKPGPRGSATFYGDGSAVVTLFETANLSTLIHETGHVFLEELQRNAARDDAPWDVKEDWAAAKAWFAANGHPVSKGAVPTEAHELWARGFERYAMEGKAPSVQLQGSFTQFRAWLLRIYQVVQNLRSPITPEVRAVFDRMLATQEQIDEQQAVQHAQPLFKNAADAGMTDEEFAAYSAAAAAAKSEAYDALLFKTMEAIRRREQSRMREQRANVRADVQAKVDARKDFIALHLLRTGRWLGDPSREPLRIKLNTGWLIDTFGEQVLDRLPRGLPLTHGDGEAGDIVAEAVGMSSGTELVEALIALREATDNLRAMGETRSVRTVLVENETDRVMAERHGDAMTDGSIEEEAIAAINTARQGDIIASEIRQLAKRKTVFGEPTPYQLAREWAKRVVEAGRVADVATRAVLQRHTRATAKAARLAEQAMLAGDIDETYRQKQAQLLNHALLAESKTAVDDVDTISARLRRLADRAAMQSVDQDYMDKIHVLLEQFEFRPKSQKLLAEIEGFATWAADQRAKGLEVYIPPRLALDGKHYTRMTVEELRGLNGMIASLLHLGRVKQKLRDAQGERDFDAFRDEVLARIEQLPTRKLPEKPINEEERGVASLAAELLKIEVLAEELDGAPSGPLHDTIVVGSTMAADARDQLRRRVLQPLAKTYNSLSRKQWRRLQEKVTIPELTWNTLNEGDPRIGESVTITRAELLTIFLNTGNLSNLEKISKGERWPMPTLRVVMERELNKEDYDLAQQLWDQIGLLWPDIVRVERALSGVVPEQVAALPIDTPYGTYQGGYWPVVYDAARSQRAEDYEGQRLDDMFGLKSGVATQKGHTITRTEATGPINLSLEKVLFDHVEQVITRIAYSEWVRDTMRIIKDRRIKGLIDTKMGPEYRKLIEPWIARQIHEGAVHAKGARWWQKTLRQARVNMTMAAMGFRFSTGIAQTLGLTASAHRIGAKWVGVGLKRITTRPRESAQFVLSRSTEMVNRNETVNRDVAEVFTQLRGKTNRLAKVQAWAFWHIGMIDRYMVSMPTWLGAYERGRGEGMNDGEASAYADKSVRLSQGSGREKDLAAIQSPNNEAMRFFTMFYTPFNVMFNAQWQGVRGLKRGDPRPAIGVTFWWLIASTLADAMLSGDLPDADDDEQQWLAWFGRNVFFGMFSGVPLARDFTSGVERKLIGEYADIGSTPVTRIYDAIEKAGRSGYDFATEGETPDRAIKQTADLTAILTGAPVSQAGATGQFLWDYSNDEADPQGFSDWYFGITRGKVPEEDKE